MGNSVTGMDNYTRSTGWEVENRTIFCENLAVRLAGHYFHIILVL